MPRIMTITRSGMTPKAIEELISRRVEETLVAQEANHDAGLIDENQSQNGDDNDNESGGNGNHGNNNGDGNQNGGNGGAKRDALVARVCTYKDSLNCQPRNFSGTEGVVGLARWFEKMELVFCISNCPSNSQVKFATCTLLDGALTWWNSHVNEIQKLENKLWNLCVKGTDIVGYTRRFQKLTLLCPRMVPENTEQKRKFDNNPLGNHVQRPPFKRQNVAQDVMVGNNEKRGYTGSAPYCNKDYRTVFATQAPRALMENERVVTCFGCGGQGYFKSECPKLKNQNHGNKAVSNDARGRAYALGGGDGNPDSNVMMGTFILNNHYAYILFDSGADRRFVSTKFSALIDIPPTVLDVSYAV
ncbi:reverse transcriptase domain-containing protein [Tanacetum coccineum]